MKFALFIKSLFLFLFLFVCLLGHSILGERLVSFVKGGGWLVTVVFIFGCLAGEPSIQNWICILLIF